MQGSASAVEFYLASPSPAFPRGRSKKNTLGGVFFSALAPCRLPTGLLLPLPFAGAAAKKKTPWVIFFFALAPCRRPTGLLLPLPFPGAGAKTNTLGGVFFFCSGPPKGRGAQRSATKRKHFAHPGPTAKKILETNDAGHEQKGATTKKTPWPL